MVFDHVCIHTFFATGKLQSSHAACQATEPCPIAETRPHATTTPVRKTQHTPMIGRNPALSAVPCGQPENPAAWIRLRPRTSSLGVSLPAWPWRSTAPPRRSRTPRPTRPPAAANARVSQVAHAPFPASGLPEAAPLALHGHPLMRMPVLARLLLLPSQHLD